MKHLDEILFHEDLPAERREEVEQLLREDPEARRIFARWRSLIRVVGDEIDEQLPDRRILILEAMRRAGSGDLLDSEEREELRAADGALGGVLEAHPGLRDALSDIESDVRIFDRVWSDVIRSRDAERTTLAAAERSAVHLHRRPSRWIWRIGAPTLIAAFVAILMLLGQRQTGLVAVTTGQDEVQLLTLGDGSTVRLLPNSQLDYHPDNTGASLKRYARLQGDAYFDIAPAREGFTVETPTAVVVVLGTSFGARASSEIAEVYLAEGSLSVASRAARTRPVVLEPGQMTRVRRSELPGAPSQVDLTSALAWSGLIVFRETPVGDVAIKLSERFDLDILADPILAEETVTGVFEASQDPEAVLAAVAAALDVRIVGSGSTRTFSP